MTTSTNQAVEAAEIIREVLAGYADVYQKNPDGPFQGRSVAVDLTVNIANSLITALRAELARPLEVAAPVGEFDDWPDFNEQAMGCGLEDRNITDRYEAMRYGWDEAMERVGERFELFLAASRVPVASVPAGGEAAEALRDLLDMVVLPNRKRIGAEFGSPADLAIGKAKKVAEGVTPACYRIQPPTPQDAAPAVAWGARDSLSFIRKTNDDYVAWCKTYYQADSLDERGMMSLHGLWAWQEQERRKAAPPPLVQPSTGEGGEGKTSFHSDSGECGRVQAPGPTDAELLNFLSQRGNVVITSSDEDNQWFVELLCGTDSEGEQIVLVYQGATLRAAIDAAILASKPKPHVVHPRDDEAYYTDILARNGGDQGEGK